ncbi:MAG: TrmB family transcriptional regulator [Candidatus Aenigmatarchaeota archaeon]|nr:MAG: TrmB family transcriptional regulator [Candidatus Aenigmarchaeota archaeon]
MLGSQEILDALKNIGLNLYERKIYVALIAKGVATAGEVSEIAKVPRSRSYDVLESLADKGFVVSQSSKPIKYVALAPNDAIERAKDNLQRKHTDTLERMDKMSKSPIMTQLESIYSQGFSMIQPSDIAGTLKGNFSINQQMKSLFKSAKSHIKVITNADGVTELHGKHMNALKSAKKRGAKIRILSTDIRSKAAKALAGVAEIKSLEKSLGRIFSVDSEHFMISLTDSKEVHPTQDVAFWAGSSHVSGGVLDHLFENLWGKYKPVQK